MAAQPVERTAARSSAAVDSEKRERAGTTSNREGKRAIIAVRVDAPRWPGTGSAAAARRPRSALDDLTARPQERGPQGHGAATQDHQPVRGVEGTAPHGRGRLPPAPER